jgi:hypothetical protein
MVGSVLVAGPALLACSIVDGLSMPIEILGKNYLSEAELAEKLGSTIGALRRSRYRDGIGYQRIPGRRGAFYGPEHIAEMIAALSVPSSRSRDSSSDNSGSAGATTLPPGTSTRSRRADGAATLDDIRRASAILAKRGLKTSSRSE